VEDKLKMRLIRLPRGIDGACVASEPRKVLIASDPFGNQLRRVLEKEGLEIICVSTTCFPNQVSCLPSPLVKVLWRGWIVSVEGLHPSQ